MNRLPFLRRCPNRRRVLVVGFLLLPTVAEAQAPTPNPERNAYFGDFHVHTSWSLDAFIMGGNLDDPTVAYRFGRGDAIVTSDGSEVRLRVPLDFMAVTDHDSTLGEMHLCEDSSDPGL